MMMIITNNDDNTDQTNNNDDTLLLSDAAPGRTDRHRNMEAFEEHIPNHVSHCFATE